MVVGEICVDPHYVAFGSLRRRASAAGFTAERAAGGPLAYFARLMPASSVGPTARPTSTR